MYDKPYYYRRPTGDIAIRHRSNASFQFALNDQDFHDLLQTLKDEDLDSISQRIQRKSREGR